MRNRALKQPECSSPSRGLTGGFPTADRRRTSDGTAALGGGRLGLGGGVLVHGIGRHGADGALNRARGIALACGPTRGEGAARTPSRGPIRARPRLGRKARRGHEEADDGWPPPVNDRRRHSLGRWKRMTGGPRPSATGGGARRDGGSGPRWAGKFSWVGLHAEKEKGRLGCLRRGREEVEGPPTDFIGLGCKSATTPAGREWSRARGTGLVQKKRKRVEGGREPFQLFKTTQTN
jgi:hypothetical protein